MRQSDSPVGDLQLESHQALVDTADLLHVEPAVLEALASEDEELIKDAKDDPVRDPRDGERLADLAHAAPGPSLQEREGVGVEEIATALWKSETVVGPDAVVEESEERSDPRPRPVAIVDAVPEPAPVFDELGVEP